MLDTVFYFILNMSITSCFVLAALLIIRQLRPLPKRIVYPLWALAFFRLIMPFTITTSWSLFNFTGGLVKRMITVETITQSMERAPDSGFWGAMNSIGAAERYVPVEYKTESLRQIFTTAAVAWIIVACAALIAAVVLYSLTRQELKKAVRIRDNIFRSDMLLSPVLVGLFHPKIILPASLDPDSDEGRLILAHENVHKSRLDNLWRMIGIFVACLHWFNPFAWIMLKAFFTDMELSCDESVIRKLGGEERKVYAASLLNFAEENRVLVSTAFGRSGVRVRVVNVLNYKKLTLIGAAASALFLLAVALVLVTNPQLRG
jgi:beta-lactamase regulating signal transducer with metallopeptidase domain